MPQTAPVNSSATKHHPSVAPSTAKAKTESVSVSDEAIAKRAYEKYVTRGCAHGFDQEDWAAATRELTLETNGKERA